MSEMFQVTVVVPAEKLGALLSALPPKLHPQIDRLIEREPGKPRGKWNKTRDANGNYQPAKGTSSDALLKLLRRAQQPLRRFEMCQKLPNEKRAALMSALDRFVKLKLVKNKGDGSYEAIK